MNPICKFDINRPECQRWMNEVYDKCRDLLLNQHAPINQYSLWWLYETPAVFKDVKVMTALDCHKLKRELDRQLEAEPEAESDEEDAASALGLILAAAGIVVLLIIWRSIRQSCQRTRAGVRHDDKPNNDPDLEEQKGREPKEAPQERKKKKRFSLKKWMRRRCRPCFLHSDNQVKEFELATEKQVATHNERMKLKIALWTKAQEQDAQKKLQKQGKQQNPKKQQSAAAKKNYNSFMPST